MTSSYAPLYALGIGPGSENYLTVQASHVLAEVKCIVGYDLYLALIPEEVKRNKIIIGSPMRKERERCLKAIDSSVNGLPTALICSGDPGVYALAGLLLELLDEKKLLEKLPFSIIPGVPALCAAAARLGAPIGHDFACISLSDLLTSWQLIEKRLEAAFSADFVCVLYNPRSHGRPQYLEKAISIAKKWRSADCPVGLAKNITRQNEYVEVSKLANFDYSKADMLSLVIIGNSESSVCGSYMLTPRGYHKKS